MTVAAPGGWLGILQIQFELTCLTMHLVKLDPFHWQLTPYLPPLHSLKLLTHIRRMLLCQRLLLCYTVVSPVKNH